ncbi:hypothetical protein NPS74_23350, partial [Cutibacterium acnes subsp. acnes]|nr:hypothetical protein [Cutibacterium acnes subsp. acnes]
GGRAGAPGAGVGGDVLAVPAPAGAAHAPRSGAVVDADRDTGVVAVLGGGVDGAGRGHAQRDGVDDGPHRHVHDDLAGGAAHQI